MIAIGIGVFGKVSWSENRFVGDTATTTDMAAPGTAIWRPAHIHLLVSGEGQQDLITQVYLEGDPHLEKDMGSMSPQAVKRILKITKNSKNEEGE